MILSPARRKGGDQAALTQLGTDTPAVDLIVF